MKIVMFIHSMGAGGAERVTANLANAWAEQGHEVTVLTLAPQTHDFYALHCSVRRIALNLAGDSAGPGHALWANLRRVRAARRVLGTIRPQLVLGMMTAAAVLAILAALGLGCRVVVAEHTYPPLVPVGRPWDWLRRKTYPLAFRVVMLTTEGLDWLKDRIPRARGAIIPNPITFPLPVTAPRLPPATYIPAEHRLLLAVGRLDDGKGFDLLLAAFALLANQYPRWDLVILGEGPERLILERAIDKLTLQGRVHLPGRAGNIVDWYARADLYVMSSRFEGFGNTLVEAMAHGCAAVSYDCSVGPRHIIRHGVNGILVTPVGDIQALSVALERLMRHDDERHRLAMEAMGVRERFSIVRILAMWDAVYCGKTSNSVARQETRNA